MVALASERWAAQPGCVFLGRGWLAGSLPAQPRARSSGGSLGMTGGELGMVTGGGQGFYGTKDTNPSANRFHCS